MTFNESLKQYRLQLTLVLPLLAWMYYRIVPDMVKDWYHDENYSHGFLVPIISGYFLWQRWPDLKERLVKPNGLGLVVIVWECFNFWLPGLDQSILPCARLSSCFWPE